MPEGAEPEAVRAYLRALDRAEKAIGCRPGEILPLWKITVPADFESYHAWDFTKFGRGERFVYQALPREEFAQTLEQVTRWGLDQHLKERSFDKLNYAAPR